MSVWVGGVDESERVDMCESSVWASDFAKSERGSCGEGRESVESVGLTSRDVCRLSVSSN